MFLPTGEPRASETSVMILNAVSDSYDRGYTVPDQSVDRLFEHYTIERRLADRLRAAPPGQRSRVYGEVYDELFRCIPDHPQLSIDPAQRNQQVLARLRFVSRFLNKDSCLM